jgi:thymidylate kinase
MSLFIFEGGDLSGKTTFAKEFSKQTGFPIIKKRLDLIKDIKSTLKEDFIERFNHIFYYSLEPIFTGYNIISDRGLISSIVFSKFFNRGYDLTYIFDFIKRNDLQIFIMKVDNETLIERYKIRGEELFNIDEVIKINEAFLEVYDELSKVKEFKNKIHLIESKNFNQDDFVIYVYNIINSLKLDNKI